MANEDWTTNQLLAELATKLKRPKYTHLAKDIRKAPADPEQRDAMMNQAVRLIARVRAYDENAAPEADQ